MFPHSHPDFFTSLCAFLSVPISTCLYVYMHSINNVFLSIHLNPGYLASLPCAGCRLCRHAILSKFVLRMCVGMRGGHPINYTGEIPSLTIGRVGKLRRLFSSPNARWPDGNKLRIGFYWAPATNFGPSSGSRFRVVVYVGGIMLKKKGRREIRAMGGLANFCHWAF